MAPRSEPFVLHGDGYQTLKFAPMAANVIAGIITETALSNAEDPERLRRTLLAVGSTCIMGALFATQWLCPINKIIWTPTCAVFGIGTSLLTLAAFLGRVRVGLVTTFLVALGTNSLLLYTLSIYFRWRIVVGWEAVARLFGLLSEFPPVIESAALSLTLWMIAYVLYRRRFFIRI